MKVLYLKCLERAKLPTTKILVYYEDVLKVWFFFPFFKEISFQIALKHATYFQSSLLFLKTVSYLPTTLSEFCYVPRWLKFHCLFAPQYSFSCYSPSIRFVFYICSNNGRRQPLQAFWKKRKDKCMHLHSSHGNTASF